MSEILERESVYLWYYFSIQLEQIFPYWVLGMAVGSGVSVFLKNWIHSAFRSLGQKGKGVFGLVIASVLGIASPLCMYGTIPVAASFSKSGVRDDWQRGQGCLGGATLGNRLSCLTQRRSGRGGAYPRHGRFVLRALGGLCG